MEPAPRILVGFDSSSDTLLAEVAVRLARALEAQLEAVFVEGLDALDFAGLPFAVLVEHSGQMHPLDPARVEALLRVAAARAEHELLGAAASARVPASFRVKRGRFLGELAREAAERDVIVVGSARHGPRRTSARGLVAVAATSGGAVPRLLDVARAVAGADEALVAVVTDARQGAEVRAWAEREGRHVHVMATASPEPKALASALSRIHPRMLVAGDGSRLAEQRADELRLLIDCPLVIVR